ncbi:AMP-binding protein [Neisseria sp. Ec49-e6-T10]|uniref:AMP-binding protein n=1 Tax=Neisseria sp. Ec49-e6-T10 TaxID=3140744 RepID=UPI003EBFDBE6
MEKIWLKHYPEGVKAEIDLNQFKSISDVFFHSCKKYANLPAFYNLGKTISFKETEQMVLHFASFLRNHLKLEPGERVAIMMPNVLQYPIALFGTLCAGLVVVNVNPLYTPRELEHQLKDSGATTIIVLENFANNLEQILEHTDIKNVVLTNVGDLLGTLKGSFINFTLKHIKKVIPNHRLKEKAIFFKNALYLGSNKDFTPTELNHNHLAFLQYTGGTTGVAKAAMLSHGNMVANMLQAYEWINGDLQDGHEVVVTALPLYHVFSLTANLLTFVKTGGKNVLITNPRDIAGFIEELKKHKITVLTGVNTLFNALVNHPNFKTVDFSTWKYALGGGMAVQQAVAESWKKITGIPICEAYGLTETSPAACINLLNMEDHTGGIGLPISSTEVSIRDDMGNELPIGQSGELFIKGPQVMQGYWGYPEETAKVLGKDGFLATGDIGVMDQNGFIKLVDRKKDMIVVSGFNVYPNELEDVIASHPKVLEVACIGVPSEKTGEAIRVFIVPQSPDLTKEEIINFCKERLTAYKVPKDIIFKDDLPKSNVGKILRRSLRDEPTNK